MEQLLKQAALNSSNAATLVLAEHIDGDVSQFTDRMNAKAKALGMNHTHFTNPSGADNHLIQPYEPKGYKMKVHLILPHMTWRYSQIICCASIRKY